MRTLFLTLLVVTASFAQNADTSNNGALHGAYFIREVYFAGQNANGTITGPSSAIGVVTFDGAGNYSFTGASGGAAVTGVYGVGSNGLLYIQSLIDGTQNAYGTLGAVGPAAFVASATENGNADILVAIPAGTSVSAAALNGNYTAGYVAFPNADVTQVREASFNLAANGAGALSNVTVSGAALNLGGSVATQTVTGGTYTLAGTGSGTLNLGAASSAQILSGSFTFYLSGDGNVFLAGTPGGDDLIVGTRAFSGTASNSSWNNIYFIGALEDSVSGTTHSIDAFYGSWNSNGQGISIAHERANIVSPPSLFDYTFDSQSAVQPNGTSAPTDVPYQFTLGAGGSVFIGTGTQGLYSLLIGFAAPKFSGTGVYLNPLGVVNAANFAPITNPIAPGEIIALFGSGLAASTVSATTLPLPTSLNNVQVTINGTPAPIFYVSPGQIAVQVPQAISPANNIYYATVQVTNNNTPSNPVTLYTNYTAPGVYATSSGGVGPAAAELSNYTLLNASNPANIGNTVLFYATGLGTVLPDVADGAAAPSNPLAYATDTDDVYVGGQQENIIFDGLTPGLAGLYQVNATIVSGTPAGADFSDIATPDAYTSEATIQVGSGTGSARTRMQALKAHTMRALSRRH